MKKYFLAILKEPYRLFFPLGIILGILGVSPWFLYAFGWTTHYSGFYHSSMMILNYLPCFIIGFLLTAMPRFSGTSTTRSLEFFYFLCTILGITILLKYQQWILAEICYMAWLLGLIRFALVRLGKKKGKEIQNVIKTPREIIWIPIGAFQGIAGTGLLILGQLKILSFQAILIGKPMMEQGLLLSVVLGIGGFLIPRLMWTYQQKGTEGTIYFHICCGILLFLSFCFEGFRWDVLASGLRAFVIGIVFLKTGVFPGPPKVKDFYVRLAWISSWMVMLGFMLAAFFPIVRVVFIHIAFIGGFSLMIFTVGMMVSMTHAGEIERLRRPLWILWIIAGTLGLALLKRIGVIFLPDAYFKFLGLAAFFWITAALSWMIFIFPRLLKFPAEDEFEQMHKEAKKTGGDP